MDTRLNSNSAIPLHIQLEEILKSNIREGVWDAGDRIPSENEMSRIYGVSRMTVRSVILRLVREGLLYRVQGKGTFISASKITGRPLSFMGIQEQLEQKGYQNTTKTVYTRVIQADRKLAEILQVEKNTKTAVIARIRFVEESPFSLHISYLPENLYPDILSKRAEFENRQLCDILQEDYGIAQKNIVETMEIVWADKEKAKLMQVQEGYALLHLEETVYGKMDRVIEYSNVYFRGDRFKLEIVNSRI